MQVGAAPVPGKEDPEDSRVISQFHLDAEGSSAGEGDLKNSKTRTGKSIKTEHSLAVAGSGRRGRGETKE